ncbi:hypothetical protein CCR94_15820 [Rhodoblastus sphagnicola]|uniref:Uncharacterized protein n=1 Tax=Rhodoblastus sphagnicola TaxID=333368 RepID=A0A2S6N3T1_9HYPH|nr:hypothetical protein [Rhodoblastus sphagnicola]MBB4198919.1 hypothetical protein [Rhodoblastus sphagnicola]PPQ29275.1 hypothetical protein CCR94_15820 [Rhodoblastus sphagnicola]
MKFSHFLCAGLLAATAQFGLSLSPASADPAPQRPMVESAPDVAKPAGAVARDERRPSHWRKAPPHHRGWDGRHRRARGPHHRQW